MHCGNPVPCLLETDTIDLISQSKFVPGLREHPATEQHGHDVQSLNHAISQVKQGTGSMVLCWRFE